SAARARMASSWPNRSGGDSGTATTVQRRIVRRPFGWRCSLAAGARALFEDVTDRAEVATDATKLRASDRTCRDAFREGAVDGREAAGDPLHLRMGSRPRLLTGARLGPSERVEKSCRSPHFAGGGGSSVRLLPLMQGHGDNLALCVEYCHPHGGAP